MLAIRNRLPDPWNFADFLLFLEKLQNEALPVVIPQPNFNHILTDDRESQCTWFHADIPSTAQENESEVQVIAHNCLCVFPESDDF